MFKFNLA